jgi:hypothetical protein
MDASTPRTMRDRGEPTSRWVTSPDGRTVILDQDRSASLLLRVWLESGTDDFRARLTTLDTSPGEAGGAEVAVAVASSPDEVITVVRTWLTTFLDPGTDMGAVRS